MRNKNEGNIEMIQAFKKGPDLSRNPSTMSLHTIKFNCIEKERLEFNRRETCFFGVVHFLMSFF